ncbi:hypothetical protein NDU88_009749, partial [Pleurodeles waltl]
VLHKTGIRQCLGGSGSPEPPQPRAPVPRRIYLVIGPSFIRKCLSRHKDGHEGPGISLRNNDAPCLRWAML